MNIKSSSAVVFLKVPYNVKKLVTIIFTVFIYSFSMNSSALEVGAALHQGDKRKMTGFDFSVSEQFSRKHNIHWSLSYNSLNDVRVEWNNNSLFFSVDTVEALISRQQKLRTYNSFLKNIVFEYQAGISVGLTENKFTWTELNEEKFFSQKKDINAVLAFSTRYNFSKNSAVKLGIKYQPNFSEFGNIASVYLGFTYKIGKQVGY
ncbi:MAG: hypothetical protein HRT37_02295 [Alteromonadaceae bacterium]|nr:hypothetical protein [Alteromonadaceae bacterium]